MAILATFAFCLIGLGIGIVLFPGAVRLLHAQAQRLRRTDEHVTGEAFAVPSLPAQSAPGFVGHAMYCWRLLTDRAFWHLLLWSVVDPFTGTALTCAPFGTVLWGVYGIVALPIVYFGFGRLPTDWYAFIPVTSAATVISAAVLGVFFVAAGYRTGPWWLRIQARWSSLLLGSHLAELQDRVAALSATREAVRDDAAAELRRIERDVHDGAQAQLVAIGMKLGTAEELLARDPAAAMALIGQAREDSSTALIGLRDLMRGVHPPVLADRGLGPALEAMAIESALPTTVDVHLPTRLDSSLEAAAYFATRELLTNAAKHAGATRLRLTATMTVDRLHIDVSDDGAGGAVIAPGGGLDGIRRRLAAFDGTIDVTSPVGGPTAIALEVPCALSSPKIR